ncbi:MAG: LysR family transcriptional regulator, partial [Clostridiales bacterium]|nr:LysR family transcriptional regulator [Clostridiales bacterium]
MNWLDIFCFTSAAKTGSFSMAAKELMISQQAVSRHIRKLEDELGFPLFLRNYQNVYLTKAGELMLSCFQDRDEILNHYRESIPNTSKHAPLRIAWSQWLGCPSSFKRILDGFITQHSDIPVFIYSLPPSELLSMMENHELDFVLMTRYYLNHQPVLWKNLILGEEPIYLFGDS